jgi:hypothetical protein
MDTLLPPKLAPITFAIGFLNGPFVRVVDAFIQWKRQHFKSISSKEIVAPLENALEDLLPLAAVPRRWLLVPTTGDWVAYFDNGVRGPDPAPVISYLSQHLSCRGVVVRTIPHTLYEEVGTKPGLYGAIQFELFAPHKTDFLNCERAVGVAYEAGKWSFTATGAVQSFEDIAKYKLRRIVDRLTPEMVRQYCRALAIDVDSAKFFQSPSLLVFAADPWPKDLVQHTLAQAQQQMGFRSAK